MKLTIKATGADAAVARKAVQTAAGAAAMHLDVEKLSVKESTAGVTAYVTVKD